MVNITIKTRVSLNDFVKVNYYFYYSKLKNKIMTGIGIGMILLNIFTQGEYSIISYMQLFFGLYLTVGVPILTYLSAKKNYNTNARLKETIEYNFDNENIIVTGESFNSKLTWEKVYKITESKDWVLIWQNKLIANIIPKRDFKIGELETLKGIVKQHKSIINKLKY